MTPDHDIYAPGATPSRTEPLLDHLADRAGAAPYDQVTPSIQVPPVNTTTPATAEVSPLNHIAPTPPTTVVEASCTLALKRIACKIYVGYQENDTRRTVSVTAWEDLTTDERANWCAAAMAVFPQLNDA